MNFNQAPKKNERNVGERKKIESIKSNRRHAKVEYAVDKLKLNHAREGVFLENYIGPKNISRELERQDICDRDA